MEYHYTVEKHTQILIALMKFHGIKKIVVSPGTTNICLVGSLQSDTFFEIYSSVDERSAAFLACGLAAETGEPVALSCTGSTASRDYIPGLTEAYYRKLPVLAITATQHIGRVDHGFSQVIDRSRQPKDVVVESVLVDCVHTREDEWACELAVNQALIALRKDGGGPVHINLVTTYNRDFSAKKLPQVKGIRYTAKPAELPDLDSYQRIAILVGCHERWAQELQRNVDRFCEIYNAVVLMNHASNYKGDYGVNHALITSMYQYDSSALRNADLVIYIGGISRYLSGMNREYCEMWRVSPDGKIWDPERMTTRICAIEELDFFEYYVKKAEGLEKSINAEFAERWQQEYENILAETPELPFSNVWIAENVITQLPENCVFHLAGANTARAWNFFTLPKSVTCYSNDGTMGIDGQVSALIGESLANPDRPHFGVVGDLTFFYDMNAIGNRHVQRNLRLMVINNGVGAEFKIYSHPAAQFGEEGDPYMAARGHYGNKSPVLLKHYAEDLGFEYLCANDKKEFEGCISRFLDPNLTERPMLFEVFTDSEKEDQAVFAMNHIRETPGPEEKPTAKETIKGTARDIIKSVAGEEGVAAVKKILRR